MPIIKKVINNNYITYIWIVSETHLFPSSKQKWIQEIKTEMNLKGLVVMIRINYYKKVFSLKTSLKDSDFNFFKYHMTIPNDF